MNVYTKFYGQSVQNLNRHKCQPLMAMEEKSLVFILWEPQMSEVFHWISENLVDTKDIRMYPLDTMDINTKIHCNSSNSGPKLWTDRLTLAIPRATAQANKYSNMLFFDSRNTFAFVFNLHNLKGNGIKSRCFMLSYFFHSTKGKKNMLACLLSTQKPGAHTE